MEGVRELAQAHPGKIPLLLCLRNPDGASVFVEADKFYNVSPGREFQEAANERFGNETYYAKVDTSAPSSRRWTGKGSPAAPPQGFPAYTGLKPQSRRRGDLTLLVGSKLKIEVTTNKPENPVNRA